MIDDLWYHCRTALYGVLLFVILTLLFVGGASAMLWLLGVLL